MKIILIGVFICWSNVCFAQYGSYENHMLNQSMSSFFYYQTSPRGFSDPRSLADTERRSALSDQYHDELEYRYPQYEAYKQRMANPYYYNRQNSFLRHQYNNRYRAGSYLNSSPGFRIPYP